MGPQRTLSRSKEAMRSFARSKSLITISISASLAETASSVTVSPNPFAVARAQQWKRGWQRAWLSDEPKRMLCDSIVAWLVSWLVWRDATWSLYRLSCRSKSNSLCRAPPMSHAVRR